MTAAATGAELDGLAAACGSGQRRQKLRIKANVSAHETRWQGAVSRGDIVGRGKEEERPSTIYICTQFYFYFYIYIFGPGDSVATDVAVGLALPFATTARVFAAGRRACVRRSAGASVPAVRNPNCLHVQRPTASIHAAVAAEGRC